MYNACACVKAFLNRMVATSGCNQAFPCQVETQLSENQLRRVWEVPERWRLNGEKPDVGVSKNMGTPKWMVYNGKPY